MMAQEILSESRVTAVINTPFEKIDLTTWLFTNAGCGVSEAHVAAGGSRTADEKRMIGLMLIMNIANALGEVSCRTVRVN